MCSESAALGAAKRRKHRIGPRSGHLQRRFGNKWVTLCVHFERRDRCSVCRGSEVCVHNRRRFYCTLCNGNGICKHGKRRSRCISCNGGGICVHNKRRSRCTLCIGGEICHHRRLRYYCAQCNGAGMCTCRKKIVRDGYCTTCHPLYVPTMAGISKIACECLALLERELDIVLRRARIDGVFGKVQRDEYRPPEMPRAPVDGYHSDSRTIFEFLGDYWHGHPRLQISKVSANHFGTLHTESHRRTEDKLRTLQQAGYAVYYIWESDYLRYKAASRKTKTDNLWPVWRRFSGKLCH